MDGHLTNNLRESFLKPNDLIREAIQKIDHNLIKIVIVVDDDDVILGTITDGDIRRGILKGHSFEDSVHLIMNKKPTTGTPIESATVKQRKMKRGLLRYLPILDEGNRVVAIESYDLFASQVERENPVVLMAGGLGSRLGELTTHTPKPMLSVGNKPLLETILSRLADGGFKNIYIAVNYKADIIENYFQDGSAFGLQIQYLHEKKQLGTAGALSLLPERPEQALLVMNADILTNVDFSKLMQFHAENRADATMSVREYALQVPYGVVRLDKHHIAGIDEKPIQRFFVNAGIYVIEPPVLDCLKNDERCDMPTLFQTLIAQGKKAAAFPIREHWIDIGKMDDFERANIEYPTIVEKP